MFKLLDQILSRRGIGVALFLVFAASSAWFLRTLFFVAQPAAKSVALEVVSHPQLDDFEPVVREHLAALRNRFDAAVTEHASAIVRARAFAALGSAYLAYDMAPAAVTCLRNAAVLDPDDYQVWYSLALAHEAAGEVSKAIAAVSQCLQAMPTDLRATPEELIAAWCLSGELSSREGDLPAAELSFRRAVEHEPDNLFAQVKLAQSLDLLGETEQAQALLEKALKTFPSNGHIRFLLAGIYRKQGDDEKALSLGPAAPNAKGIRYSDPLLESVSRLNLSSAYQDRQGQNLMNEGLYAQAADHFRRAVVRDPEKAVYRTHLGNALLNLQRPRDAARELDAAVRLNPGSEDAVRLLCLAWLAIPDMQGKAIDRAREWRAAHPESLTALQVEADVLARAHQYADAFEAYSEAARRDPGLVWARLGQAVMKAACRDYAASRDLFTEAVKVFPAHDQLRHNFARLLVACADDGVRDAQQGLKIAQELFDSQPSVIRASTLALALAELNRLDEARQRHQWAQARYRDEGGAAMTARLSREWECLKAGTPYREPWPFSDEP